jgi:hypothetical protein
MTSDARRSTLKTILLVIASGIGGIVIFVVAVIGFISYKVSTSGSHFDIGFPSRPPEKTVSKPPPVDEVERFLGSHGIYSGDFTADRRTVLDAGPGRLAARITYAGKPVAGLRLRLAVNGKVMTQWGTSGADGKYEVAVPYAQYRIDGYELDSASANTTLRGLIDNPQNSHWSEIMTVAEGRRGRALDLDFVDPVKKKGPAGEVSLAKPVVITWEPYPRATGYRVQLIEQKDPRDYINQKRLFDWNGRPTITGTSLDLSQQGIALQKGFYYSIEIDALEGEHKQISRTGSTGGRADFFVIDDAERPSGDPKNPADGGKR